MGWDSEGANGRVWEIRVESNRRCGRRRRRDREGETQEERKGKDINGGEKKHLIHFRILQITTDPMSHKITYQTSRDFQTFGSQSEIGSTFRHWTCSLLELGSLMAVTTPAYHLHIQGENHRIRIRGRRHPACRFSS